MINELSKAKYFFQIEPVFPEISSFKPKKSSIWYISIDVSSIVFKTQALPSF